MNYLDSKYIQLIEADVESARITINNLSDELVDHICCEVEALMSSGKSFEDAYGIIKEQTGIKVLQKIQENTLYLIDKKYKLMKTTMKITGNVSLAIIAFGTAFKIYHWPGASPLLILGFLLLCFVFFPAAIFLNYTYAAVQRKPLLNISIGLGGIIFMIGVLFKLMHWPGAAMLLLAGWSIILAIFLPILLFVKLKSAQNAKEKRIYILGALGLLLFEAATMFKMFHWPGAGPLMILGSFFLIGLFVPMYTAYKMKKGEIGTPQFIFVVTVSMYAVVLTFLLAMNVSDVVLDRFVQDESNASKIVNYFEKKKSKMASLKSDSSKVNNEAVTASVVKIQGMIHDIKITLVQRIEGGDKAATEALIKEPYQLKRKDNYDIVNHVLLEEDNGMISGLKKAINDLKKVAVESCTSDAELSKNIEALLNTSDVTINGEKRSWEDVKFRSNMIIGTLAVLGDIEKNALLVETLINK